MSGVCRVFYKTLGIKRGAPTTIEQEFFKTWTKDYGFGEDIVEEAASVQFYIHRILRSNM